MSNLRNKLVKLANDNPDGIREHLVPILKETSTTKQAGYTHYWDILRPFTDQEWSKIIQVSKQIIAKAARTTKLKAPSGDYYDEEIALDGIQIFGPFGTGKPILNNKLISLNGNKKYIGPDGPDDLSHESFYMQKETTNAFAFCKTARKPYDAVVVSILASIKKIAPGALKISGGSIRKVL